MDAVWLENPIPYFNNRCDLQGQMHKEIKISGGFVVVRSTTYGRYFWRQVIECQRANALFLSTHEPGSYEPSKYTEQYCINELSRELLSKQPLFSRHLLDPLLFPDGRSFFDWHESQVRGITPIVVHNNWITGRDAKIQRLKDWGLWAAQEHTDQLRCAAIPSLDRTNKQLDMHARQLTIKIVAGTHPDGLQRLLTSLSAADYSYYDENDKNKLLHVNSITVEISIDEPNVNAVDAAESATLATAKANWLRVQSIAAAFTWNYGNVKIVNHKHHTTAFGHWV